MNDTALVDELTKLVVSLFAGAIIGAEREYKSKSVGFRTVILVTLGSTLFTIVSNYFGSEGRIASNIVTGVGFLGAGAIFRDGDNVKGITTATTIWVAAAIGMSIGFGKYDFAAVSLLLVMIVLLSFTSIQRFIEKTNKVESYEITISDYNLANKETLSKLFESCKLRASCNKTIKHDNQLTFIYSIQGPAVHHEKLIELLTQSKFIFSFEA